MDRAEFWDAVVIAAAASGQWQAHAAFAFARLALEARDEFAASNADQMAQAVAAGDGHWQRRAENAEMVAGAALDLRERVAHMLALSPAASNDKIVEALIALKSRARAVGQAVPGAPS